MFPRFILVLSLIMLGFVTCVAFGQNPDQPQITEVTISNTMGIAFQSEAGTDYELEFTTNLYGQSWQSSSFTAQGDGSVLTLFDPSGPRSKMFYRLIAIGPGAADPDLSFEADSGDISAPFSIFDGVVSQPPDSGTTTPTTGGRAGYVFNVTDPGDYRVKMMVDAPHAGSDSFYINIDAEPVSGNYMTWDIIPLTSGFEERTVSWRGNGTFSAPEFPDKIFNLSVGNHELIVRGREGGTKVETIALEKVEAGGVDGACGSAHGETLPSAPSSGLCDAGTPSTVTLSGNTYSWTCFGIDGGADVSCSATHQPGPIDGACGGAHGGSFSDVPSSDLCAQGAAGEIIFDGETYSWTCYGLFGGADVACGATHVGNVDPSLVLWLEFNGNANDSSNYGNHGVSQGASLTQDKDGNPNAAYHFDGTAHIVVANDDSLNVNSLTAALWFRANSLADNAGLLAKGSNSNRQYWLWTYQNTLSAEVGRGGVHNSLHSLQIGQWYHIALTYDAGTLITYIDGIEVDRKSQATGEILSDASDLLIGQLPGFQNINGVLDDVRIYNRALGVSEIQVLAGPIDGACGSAHGGTFGAPPTSALCSSGTAGAVTQVGDNYVWTCDGLNGGASVSCSASHDELPPVAQDLSLIMVQDTTLNGQVVATDQNGDSLTYVLQDNVTQGSLQFNSDGSFVYTPVAGYIGVDVFTFVANDGQADSGVAVVDITVNDASQVGDVYWVSASGSASWAECKSQTPLDGAAACSISTANANAVAGDTVYLRGTAEYTGNGYLIKPARSGTPGEMITFSSFNDEDVVFRGCVNSCGVQILGKSYIKVHGIKIIESRKMMQIMEGSDHNEISHCEFLETTFAPGGLPEKSWILGNSRHNWIHNSIFSRTGTVRNCDDKKSVINIGGSPGSASDTSSHNLIEHNTFYMGGHDVVGVHSPFNIIRENYLHNEPWMPCSCQGMNMCGNRNFETGSQYSKFNLFERNRIGFASTPADNPYGPGIEMVGFNQIVRRNDFFHNGAAAVILIDKGFSDARSIYVYHNTMFHNGYSHKDGNIKHGGVHFRSGTRNHVVKNNIMHDNKDGTVTSGSCSGCDISGNWREEGDPKFVSEGPIPGQPFGPLPDLNLQANSPVIDAAIELTNVANSDSGGLILTVNDAMYFQDGSWGSDLSPVEADWIAVGNGGNVAQIESINYDNGQITLDRVLPRSASDSVWLFKDSYGDQVFVGSAPDIGAHEF